MVISRIFYIFLMIAAFFFGDKTAKKKAKQKRNRGGSFAACARRQGLRALDRRRLAGAGVSGSQSLVRFFWFQPLFSLAIKRQRKKLSKKETVGGVSPRARGDEGYAPSTCGASPARAFRGNSRVACAGVSGNSREVLQNARKALCGKKETKSADKRCRLGGGTA